MARRSPAIAMIKINTRSSGSKKAAIWPAALAMAALFLPNLRVSAATVQYTWDAGANTSVFSTANNWNPNTTPTTTANNADDDLLVFPSGGLVNSVFSVSLNQGDSQNRQAIGKLLFNDAGVPTSGYTLSSAAGPYEYRVFGISGVGIENSANFNQTFNLDVEIAGNVSFATVNASSSLTFGQSVIMDSNGKALELTGAGGFSFQRISNLTGSDSALTMSGSGIATVSGEMKNLSGVTVNSGTLLFGPGIDINDTDTTTRRTNFQLGGGTLDSGGQDADTFGNLTLSANSTIDFGSGLAGSGGDLIFRRASSPSDLGSFFLTVNDWNGDVNMGGGTDQLVFGAIRANGINYSAGQVITNFLFNTPSGTLPGLVIASPIYGGLLEIVPVPEPSTWAILVLLGGGLGWREWRRYKPGVSASRFAGEP